MKGRPEFIQQRIDAAFNHVQGFNDPWRENGKTTYEICDINEFQLIKALVSSKLLSHNPYVFRIMYIGAGNFRFGNGLFESLSKADAVYPGVKFEIFSLRAEPIPYLLVSEARSSNCIHYRLGNFKIENITEEFRKIGIDIIDSVDFAVSSWTMRHLVDPVGTLLQIHHSLKNEGMLLSDGFYFKMADHQPLDINHPSISC